MCPLTYGRETRTVAPLLSTLCTHEDRELLSKRRNALTVNDVLAFYNYWVLPAVARRCLSRFKRTAR